MEKCKKKWILLEQFYDIVGINKNRAYNAIYHSKEWTDGYVVKKKDGVNRWKYGCVEDYYHWLHKKKDK